MALSDWFPAITPWVSLRDQISYLTQGLPHERWALREEGDRLFLDRCFSEDLSKKSSVLIGIPTRISPVYAQLEEMRRRHPELAGIPCPQHGTEGLHYTRGGIAHWDEAANAHVSLGGVAPKVAHPHAPPAGYAWELEVADASFDEENKVTYDFRPKLSRVENLKLYRHARLPKHLKKKILAPYPGGRWWGVGEVARIDLPKGCDHERPWDAWTSGVDWVERLRCSRTGGGHIVVLKIFKAFRAGCRVYFYPFHTTYYEKDEFFVARSIDDPVVSLAYTDTTPWAAYVLGFRGGLELPPVSMLSN